MIRTSVNRVLIPLGLLTSLACTSCASLHGAWYYQSGYKVDSGVSAGSGSDAGSSKNGVTKEDCVDESLYLAIVNKDYEELDVSHVDINAASEASQEAGPAGWTCDLKGKPVRRGQLLVLTLPLSGNAQCAIPLHATLRTTGKPRNLQVSISDSTPSALPTVWLNCPWANNASKVCDNTGGYCSPKPSSGAGLRPQGQGRHETASELDKGGSN